MSYHSHKVYNLVVFSMLTKGATIITVSCRTFSSPSKIPLSPSSSSCSSPSPGQPLTYFLYIDVFIMDISYKWDCIILVFCDWLLLIITIF